MKPFIISIVHQPAKNVIGSFVIETSDGGTGLRFSITDKHPDRWSDGQTELFNDLIAHLRAGTRPTDTPR